MGQAGRRRARAADSGAVRRAGAAALVRFAPTPSAPTAGITITTVRERMAAIAEIVKVVPQSVPATDDAPGGLAFALIVLTASDDAAIAEAGGDHRRMRVERGDPGGMPLDQCDPGKRTRRVSTTTADDDDDVRRRGHRARRGRAPRRRAGEAVGAGGDAVPAGAQPSPSCRTTGVDVRALAQVVSENGRQLRDLRASIMRARMVSVSELLERVPL